MPDRDVLSETYFWLICGSAIFQTLFVIIWARLPWWRTWVGRALMIKSFALMLALNMQLYFVVREVPIAERLSVAIPVLGFIFIGILSQNFALIHEMWRSRNKDELSSLMKEEY